MSVPKSLMASLETIPTAPKYARALLVGMVPEEQMIGRSLTGTTCNANGKSYSAKPGLDKDIVDAISSKYTIDVK